MTGYVRRTKCKPVRCLQPGCEWFAVLFGADRKQLDAAAKAALVRHALKHFFYGMRALNLTHVEHIGGVS